MARFEIVVSPKCSDPGKVLPEGKSKLQRFRTGLAAFLILSTFVGILIAALFLGSIIAIVVLILVALAFLLAAIRTVFWQMRGSRT
jgi:hypothetical protein